mmetsp:Transcript_48266/g.127800  ORF Transcript_48266/g.127800 Transcript_48266/m.127800 type:complete len:188 (-) Transcript_48266:15-578(-)
MDTEFRRAKPNIFPVGWEDSAVDAAADARIWKRAQTFGLRGTLAIEGHLLPSAPLLAHLLQRALETSAGERLKKKGGPSRSLRVFVRPGGALTQPRGPSLGVPCAVNCFRFAVEAPDDEDVEELSAYLQLEAEHRGSVGLIKEVATLLEEGEFQCDHCRVWLEVSNLDAQTPSSRRPACIAEAAMRP